MPLPPRDSAPIRSARKHNKNAVAETIEDNVRGKTVNEHLSHPAFHEMMSALLNEFIAARKSKALVDEAPCPEGIDGRNIGQFFYG